MNDYQRAPGAAVSESGRLCHGDGGTKGVPAAGGRLMLPILLSTIILF